MESVPGSIPAISGQVRKGPHLEAQKVMANQHQMDDLTPYATFYALYICMYVLPWGHLPSRSAFTLPWLALNKNIKALRPSCMLNATCCVARCAHKSHSAMMHGRTMWRHFFRFSLHLSETWHSSIMSQQYKCILILLIVGKMYKRKEKQYKITHPSKEKPFILWKELGRGGHIKWRVRKEDQDFLVCLSRGSKDSVVTGWNEGRNVWRKDSSCNAWHWL